MTSQNKKHLPPFESAATVIALILVIFFGFILRFQAADHDYLSQWDEAYHALVAKNLSIHPLRPTLYEEHVLPHSEQDWTQAHIWMHKPPLPLWLMAASLTIFSQRELSIRLPSVVLDCGVMFLLFLIAAALFDQSKELVGLTAAFFYAVNPLMIRLVSGRIPDDHTHLITVFFITLTVLTYVLSAQRDSRFWAACAGASLGLSTLCMSAVGLLGMAATLPLFLMGGKRRRGIRLLLISVITFLLIALPWPLYCLHRWPEQFKWESTLQFQHLFIAIDGHAHSAGWFVRLLPLHYGGLPMLTYLFSLLSLTYAAFVLVRDRDLRLSVPLVWTLLPYVFYSMIQTKLYSYVCVAVPSVSLLMGYALSSLWGKWENLPRSKFARTPGYKIGLASAMLAWGAQTTVVIFRRLAADYSICPWNELYDYPTFRRAMMEIGHVPGPKVIFNVGDRKSVQAMYYANCPAYGVIPSSAELHGLIQRGFQVYFLIDEEKRGEPLQAIRSSGLLDHIQAVIIPKPREILRRHPYAS